MKKIAIPVTGNALSPHFGHCEEFYIYEINDDKIVNETQLVSPPHEPGLLPGWLKQHDVTDVIAGGMGHRAINLFNQHNINVFVGAPVELPKDIITSYLGGSLKLSENLCDH